MNKDESPAALIVTFLISLCLLAAGTNRARRKEQAKRNAPVTEDQKSLPNAPKYQLCQKS